MTIRGKDSDDVVEFMTLFNRLKKLCDDAPEKLTDRAKEDENVKNLCTELSWKAFSIEYNERRHPELFAAPVDPKFVAAWRDYEKHYSSVLSSFRFPDDLYDWLGLGAAEPNQTPEHRKVDLLWEFADDEAVSQAKGIENAINFAYDQGNNQDNYYRFPEEFCEEIEAGVDAWKKLNRDMGFDLRSVFRRRELVPFVLVPRSVAAKYGSADKLSMLKTLRQAHEAFVFGSPYASLALMRSIVEVVLRDHYRVDGEDLHDLIKNASDQLPDEANEARLHRLRKQANVILHPNPAGDKSLPRMDDEAKLEKEILSYLFAVRALIENVE